MCWPGSVSDGHSVINLGDRKLVSLQLRSDPSFDKRQRRRLLAILRCGFLRPSFACPVTKRQLDESPDGLTADVGDM